MNVELRQQAEREIVLAAIAAIVAAGWALVGADNGEERVRVDSPEAALEHSMQCDEGAILFRREEERARVCLVYGNTGWDVMSDWSVALEGPLGAVDSLIDSWAAKMAQGCAK